MMIKQMSLLQVDGLWSHPPGIDLHIGWTRSPRGSTTSGAQVRIHKILYIHPTNSFHVFHMSGVNYPFNNC